MRIDFHAHVLPLADHGCDGEETARFQMAAALEAGITVQCVTPHFYPNRHTVARHLQKLEVGQEILSRISKKPELRFGAEVLLCEGLEEMEGLEKLCFTGTRTLLLELPSRPFNDQLAATVRRLIHEMEYTVVYAHIERYPPEVRRAALALNPLAQINVQDTVGFFHRAAMRRLLQECQVVALGSDIHQRDNTYVHFPTAEKLLPQGPETLYRRTAALLGLEA